MSDVVIRLLLSDAGPPLLFLILLPLGLIWVEWDDRRLRRRLDETLKRIREDTS